MKSNTGLIVYVIFFIKYAVFEADQVWYKQISPLLAP